jgi:hypothetical protein
MGILETNILILETNIVILETIYTLGERISACVDAVIDILFECMCPCIYVYTITRAHKRIRAEAAICDFFYV